MPIDHCTVSNSCLGNAGQTFCPYFHSLLAHTQKEKEKGKKVQVMDIIVIQWIDLNLC